MDDDKKYEHPPVILHIPDFYDGGDTRRHKWKDRFCTTVATSATGLIRYLTWPGDRRRVWADGRTAVVEAAEHGPFMVYRPDPEATAALLAEMEKMDPAARWQEDPTRPRWVTPLSNTAFAKELRAAVKRAAGL